MQPQRWVTFSVGLLGLAASAVGQVIDAFDDGGIVLPSAGTVVGAEGPSAALGGWRAFTFLNSFNSGTLTLDDVAGVIRITSTGLGQVSVGYGWRLSPGGGGLIAFTPNQLNANWSGYTGLRFHVRENGGHMRLQVSLTTVIPGDSRSSATGQLLVTTPAGGTYDLPFSAIPPVTNGGVLLNDLDFMYFTMWNGFVGETVSLERISLIPLVGDIDADGDVDSVDQELFVGVLLGTNTNPLHVARSDLNGDSATNGADVPAMTAALLP